MAKQSAQRSLDDGDLSRWWRYGVLAIFVVGFGVLVWITVGAYKVSPPIPEKVVGASGEVVFTGEDIRDGQEVFLKTGLMDNGSIWGHGAYLGPDFSAQYLHQLAVDVGAGLKAESPQGSSSAQGVREAVGRTLAENRYDPRSHTLVFTRYEAESFQKQIGLWKSHLASAQTSRGLHPRAFDNPQELRQLVAFFAWTAWASAAHVPGKAYSYTNNFPYEIEADNGPSSEALLWSAMSLIALLAGTAAVLFAFGRFDYLGWHGSERPEQRRPLATFAGGVTATQRAALKFFVVVAALLLAQTTIGGAVAHYRAEPGSFYGVDLASLLPSNLLRTWHLQAAVFWVATAYVGGGLVVASAIGRKEPKGQTVLVGILFGALLVVVAGSLLGELLGLRQLLGKAWFWFGHQGWEYLELGRAWQFALAVGLLLWVWLLVRGVGDARKDPKQRELNLLFLAAAFAIPLFYLPAFFFSSRTNFTVVDTWRFWIIHLWVEGFFELFTTVMVATMFYHLGMVSGRTAKRVIYLDAVLFLGAGIIGTGHHWYWTGQTTASMALSAVFSSMEVVPLILLTLDAAAFMRLMRSGVQKRVELPHKWTFYFLISVGVWNFIGAGIFGFLINLPIVSYYEVGTNLTPTHGHAAFMGVFGMLGMAFLAFSLRHVSDDGHWKKMEKYVRLSYLGLNVGLGLMVVLSLFPTGVLQLLDVMKNGYWHARSAEFLDSRAVAFLEWLRLPADSVFILLGVVPMLVATALTYLRARKPKGA